MSDNMYFIRITRRDDGFGRDVVYNLAHNGLERYGLEAPDLVRRVAKIVGEPPPPEVHYELDIRRVGSFEFEHLQGTLYRCEDGHRQYLLSMGDHHHKMSLKQLIETAKQAAEEYNKVETVRLDV